MNTPPISITVIQKNGTNLDLQSDLKVMLRKILCACDITTGNFAVNILAPSENTLSARTIIFRTADVRSVQIRASGHKTGTWNVSLSGPNNLGIFSSIQKKSSKRHFEYDEKYNITAGLNLEVPVPTPTITPVQTQTPTTVVIQKADRFSITKSPEHLVLALSYIAEACDQKGHINFKEVCKVINQNFAEEGEEISEAKIRPSVTGLLVTKGYLTVISSIPTVYKLSDSGIALLEQNSMIKAEVKAKCKVTPVVKTTNDAVSVNLNLQPNSPLQKGLGNLEIELARYDNLQRRGSELIEVRNTMLTREKVLIAELQALKSEQEKIDAEIKKTVTELTNLNGVRERYDKIMKLIAGE